MSVLTDDGGLEVDEDGPGHVLPGAGLGEEGGEGVVAHGLVGGHLAVRLDAVLQAVQLPAGVAHLDAGLADVDGDALAHVAVGGGGGGGGSQKAKELAEEKKKERETSFEENASRPIEGV